MITRVITGQFSKTFCYNMSLSEQIFSQVASPEKHFMEVVGIRILLFL
jgi:hypothetical protein